jgi:hypothetical protein
VLSVERCTSKPVSLLALSTQVRSTCDCDTPGDLAKVYSPVGAANDIRGTNATWGGQVSALKGVGSYGVGGGGAAELQKGDWVLDHMEEELAFMRGADFCR